MEANRESTANLDGIGMTSRRTRERLIAGLEAKGIRDSAVLDVMRATPRHIFIDEAFSHLAYEDRPVNIGYKQTISQPYVVARMTEAVLQDGPLERVLEIGSGCGYQTAIIAQLAGAVYSIERIKPLHDQAVANLRLLGIDNASLIHGDGSRGHAEQSPYDAIIVTAAPLGVPRELLAQLAEKGRLVIPVGGPAGQELRQITRHGEQFHSRTLDHVRFVPLLKGQLRF